MSTPKLKDNTQHLLDLVRYQRGELHLAGLITDNELVELISDHGAVARLESYDEVIEQNKIFRRLLWTAWSNGRGYGDDGEMQFEGIDFKRMTAQEIQAALIKNGDKKMLEFFSSEAGKKSLEQTNG